MRCFGSGYASCPILSPPRIAKPDTVISCPSCKIELSLTQVLDRPVSGRIFFEEVIRENLDIGRPKQVQLIFERWGKGKVPGGVLRHKGWRAEKIDLPPIAAQSDIIAPAELEIE